MSRHPFILSLALIILPFASPSLAAEEPTILPSPAGANSSLSRVITSASGNVHLSWVTSTGDLTTLYFSTLFGGTWSTPQQIAAGTDWFVNWADFPFFVANAESKAANWLQKSSEGPYNYDVVATFYDAGTHRWSEGRIIHSDGISAEHGFVSMLPLPGERTFISWLDGRNTVSTHGKPSNGGHGSGGMTLRAGIFDTKGKAVEEWELDPLVCDCCQTSAAMTDKGPVVVYRNRSEGEIRDTYITRHVGNEWTRPAPVFEDNWEIAGCPVNGPSVAARGEQLAVASFSAKENEPKVYLSVSRDSGASFDTKPIVHGNTNGRVSTAILESGNIAVSWLETAGTRATLKLGFFTPAGDLVSSSDIAETHMSRRSGFPVIAARGNDVFITWTDITSDSQVRIARVRL